MKTSYTLFRAYSLLVISMFTIIITLMVSHLNPKAESNKFEAQAPGDIVVHIVWPNGNIDVDLWLSGPGEPIPVGYSNKGGVLWNLLRDDLGAMPDATPINYEDAFTRGIVDGEYIINVQCYRCGLAKLPMPIHVGLSVRDRGNTSQQLQPVAVTEVIMREDHVEKTAFRFMVTNGKVDKESLNNVYKKLRGRSSSSSSITDTYSIPPAFRQSPK